jgi:hypothetical protein
MPVSPRDFALWAAATGNRYPQTAEEKASAAPEAYDFVRNIGKTGPNAPGPRVGGRIVFEQPISAQNADDNSVFHSPVTPDNNIPKVAGTYDNTMTGEHYDNQQRDLVEDNRRSNNIVDVLGKAALAAGLTAGGVALATNPAARSAVRGAIDTAQHQTESVGSRISSFLGNLGAARVTDSEVIQNIGDVTPPTTGQRYQQEKIPTTVQTLQAAKGANVGTPEREIVPTTTEATAVKPITESDIITSSQTFAPRESGYRSSSLASFEEAVPPSEAVQTARRQAATEQLARASESIRSRAPYQPDLPGINTTLMSLRSKDVGIDPESAGLYQAPAAPSKLGPTTEQMQLLSQTPDPWTGQYTPTVEKVSQQTADLSPSVGVRAEQLISKIEGEQGVPTRVRPVRRTELSPETLKAYEIVASGAERGVKIDPERAFQIATDPSTALTHSEQQAFEFAEPVALAGQSFTPGETVTGQTRTLRTGEQRGQRAEDLLERYARENVSGLTPKGRQSAGAQRLRGIEEQDEPRAVLTTPTGRAMRNISALDPQALAEGEIQYATFTGQTTGSNPETAAAAFKSATSPQKVAQMNALFGPDTSKIMLHIKTEQGIKPVAATELYRNIKPIAESVFDRAANYYAAKSGVELPSKETNYGDYLQTANSVIYGNKETASEAIPLMAKAFNQGLQERGLNLSVNQDSEMAPQALHTLMGIARKTTGGEIALEHFSRLAGRARSRGVIRTPSTQVPVGIPGPSTEQVAAAMRQAGL